MFRVRLRKTQRGFLMAYLLYGIALIAFVSAAYARFHNNTEQSEYIQESVDTLLSQIETIKTKIFLCAAIYPDGDHGEFAARYPYPAPAGPSYRAGVSSVSCPGAPSGSRSLAVIGDGNAIPIPPRDFSAWEYEHSLTNGIRLHLVPAQSNGAPQIRARLLRKLGSSATQTGDDIAITILN